MARTTGLLGGAALCGCLLGPAFAQEAPRRGPSPELDACRTTGLLALKERSPGVTDIVLDPDSTTIAKADTKVEDTPIRTVVIGDAYMERKGSGKPYRFVCLIGEKGKVVLTFFTQQ